MLLSLQCAGTPTSCPDMIHDKLASGMTYILPRHVARGCCLSAVLLIAHLLQWILVVQLE